MARTNTNTQNSTKTPRRNRNLEKKLFFVVVVKNNSIAKKITVFSYILQVSKKISMLVILNNIHLYIHQH